MGRVSEGALHGGIVLLPVRTAHIPIGEPFLLGFEVLHLHVENPVVCDEGFEALVVVSCEPIDAESAEGSPYAAKVVAVDIGLAANLVNGSQVVAHALPAVIAADGSIPLIAEARQPTAVGRHHDIALRRHCHEVPAVTPELAHRRLRSALAEEQGGVFLRGVEMRRIDHPCQHLLSIGRPLPTRLHGAHRYLRVDISVLIGERSDDLVRIHRINLVGALHGVAQADEVVADMPA